MSSHIAWRTPAQPIVSVVSSMMRMVWGAEMARQLRASMRGPGSAWSPSIKMRSGVIESLGTRVFESPIRSAWRSG